MRQYKTTIILILTIVLLLSLFPLYTYAQQDTKNIKINRQEIVFSIDGEQYESPVFQQAFIYNSRTYVSIRFASDILEKWIDWDSATRTILVSEPTEEQLQQLRELKKEYLVKGEQPENEGARIQHVNVKTNFSSIVVDNEIKELPSDVTTFFMDGTNFIPLRYLGELFENEVGFDEQSYTVIINSQSYLEKQEDKEEVEIGTPLVPSFPSFPIIQNPSQTPTKDELVSKTTSELASYKSTLSSSANSLFTQYKKESDVAKKRQLETKAFVLMNDADEHVEALISKLEKDASSQGLSLDGEADRIRKEYKKERQEILDYILDNL